MGSDFDTLIASFREQRRILLEQLAGNDSFVALSKLAPLADPVERARLEAELATNRSYAALRQIDDSIALLTARRSDEVGEPMSRAIPVLEDEPDWTIASASQETGVSEPAGQPSPPLADPGRLAFGLGTAEAEQQTYAIARSAEDADRICTEPLFAAAEPLSSMIEAPGQQARGARHRAARREAEAQPDDDGLEALPGSRMRRAEIDATVESIAFAVASITSGRLLASASGERRTPHQAEQLPAIRPTGSEEPEDQDVEARATIIIDDEQHLTAAQEHGDGDRQLGTSGLIDPARPRALKGGTGRAPAIPLHGVARRASSKSPRSALDLAVQPGQARRSAAWADEVMGRDRARPTLIGAIAGEAAVDIQVGGSGEHRRDNAEVARNTGGSGRTGSPRVRRFLQALTGEKL